MTGISIVLWIASMTQTGWSLSVGFPFPVYVSAGGLDVSRYSDWGDSSTSAVKHSAAQVWS